MFDTADKKCKKTLIKKMFLLKFCDGFFILQLFKIHSQLIKFDITVFFVLLDFHTSI